jgi:DUF1365 family protein
MHSALYEGTVRHRRFTPVGHGFTYTLFMAYLDLSELDTVFRGRWLWSASRPAAARFRREDHLGEPNIPLDEAVRALVAQKTGRRPEGPIRLLTHLAYYGWCFNPVSFFYCFDRSGTRVETVVAEVSNTPWLERHCYVIPRGAGVPDGGVIRFAAKKEFHVSPFMGMDQSYEWLFRDPAERLSVHMTNLEAGRRVFDATMTLERREISGPALASALARWPFMTLKVVGAIHWQALKLWAKDVPVFTHPGSRSEDKEAV